MLVVADSSPINILIRINHIHVLPTLFDRVVIPTEVAAELGRPRTPQMVKDFLAGAPGWLEVREPTYVEPIPRIDAGERAAISLARELHADLLLVDDWEARQAAVEHQVAIIGTIGVLEMAGIRGLIDLREAISRIQQSDFRVSDELIEQVLHRFGEREGRD
jgi:predicted nucleic acid-binding protein